MAKSLVFDLETSPIISYNWGIYEQNAIEVIEDWQILCFAYKWLGDKHTHVVAQDDFKDYKKGINNDKHVIEALWALFDEADILIGHNSKSFDVKKSNARFMYYSLPPPSPYQQLDTRSIARKYAGFTSNKLDDLGDRLQLGRKEHTGGFDTWKGCMAGEPKAWARMKKYNKQDVLLDEKLYLRFLPWIEGHPALNIYDGRPNTCRNCGSDKIHAGMKYRATNTNLFQYFRCMGCGANLKSRIPEPNKAKPMYV